VEAGAIGVSCATLGEAEAMARAGIKDILIANQVVSEEKLIRLARLQENCDLKLTVDSLFGIQVAETVARAQGCVFEVLVEVDTGGNRCGVQTPEEAARLLEHILECRVLRFGGVQAYNGGTSYIPDLGERQRAVEASDLRLGKALAAISRLAEIPRVSGSGTGNARHHLENGLLTEIQAGSYVYSDTTYRQLAPDYRNALFVLSTVISQPLGSRLVMDAGLKSLGTEFSHPELVGYPQLNEYQFSEEHLQWEVEEPPVPQIGEKVLILPSHCCTTVNLHRRCFVIRDEIVEDVWEIDAF
jgi:D-serine deaminase-like pyridoxal phosphate-dependent protein